MDKRAQDYIASLERDMESERETATQAIKEIAVVAIRTGSMTSYKVLANAIIQCVKRFEDAKARRDAAKYVAE